MIAIIDYGAGNVESVAKALRYLGKHAELTSDSDMIERADAVILPGVGAFGSVTENLRSRGLEKTVKMSVNNDRQPFLGICVGLQMLFESSEESPEAAGLGVLEGRILKLPTDKGLKVPHIGWNSIEYDRRCPIFKGLPENPYVYFVHSYYLKAADESIVTARSEYGTAIHAAVQKDNCFATQFHPEKSGEIGLMILENFCRM